MYGDPVCSFENKILLAHEFHRFCEGKHKNIVYLTASESFATAAMQSLCKVRIEYGEEISLNPRRNPTHEQGTHASLVRRKVRHAKKNGVTFSEYIPENLKIEKEIEEVGVKWLKSRKGPQIHISRVHLFENRQGKRWFFAEKDHQIIGTIVLNELNAFCGWHMNHLMTTDDAPNGTPELLVISTLETLEKEGCLYVSCGAAAKNKLGSVEGLNSCKAWVARTMFLFANKIFHLDGHKIFWGKFFPETRPSYLLFQNSSIAMQDLGALMRALNVY